MGGGWADRPILILNMYTYTYTYTYTCGRRVGVKTVNGLSTLSNRFNIQAGNKPTHTHGRRMDSKLRKDGQRSRSPGTSCGWEPVQLPPRTGKLCTRAPKQKRESQVQLRVARGHGNFRAPWIVTGGGMRTRRQRSHMFEFAQCD